MNVALVVALVALQAAAPSVAPFPDRAVRELAAFRAGITADAWLAAHPRDDFTPFAHSLMRENHDRWCARASLTDGGASGADLVRYAYFYPPAPPPSLALPGAGGAGLAREQCVLGTIWVEARVPDSASGTALALRVRELLTRAHGPVQAGPDAVLGRVPPDSLRQVMTRLPGAEALLLGLHFFGAAGWRVPGRWQVDSTIVVSTFDAGLAPPRRSGRVLAFAYLPLAQLGSFQEVTDAANGRARSTAALAGQAARLSGADPRSVDHLLALLAAADSAYQGGPQAHPGGRDILAVRVLGDWMATTRGLDAPHRAAALLAADQVLGSAGVEYVLAQGTDSAPRLALEALGAGFARDELGGGYNYAHTWLDVARRLAPSGRVGSLATLALLRMGFNETGTCGGGAEAFRQVSAEGE
ncbi:MAG TPA: hypothetical protein VH158_08875, partial [Gemmatimonadales bacterium]|nr:hypothetical protein [Gemmatimonadales bacterium]